MAVEIPVKTKYDGRGVDQAEKDLRRLQQEQIKATRQQISEHRKTVQLTSKLDKDLAAAQQARIQQYKDLGAAAAIAGGIIVGYSADAVANAREAMAAEAQLAAGIESTGGAAGQSLEALKAHASALQDITNFSDDAIEGGQSILLTFTNIRDTFPEATAVMLDMAERMGKDLPGAANTLGKALNDPIDGISALTRFGVQFTDQQKEQIKAMVEMGNIAGAQKIILAELAVEFGGSAEAARMAAGGQKDLEVSTGELSEAWGKLLIAIGDAGVTGGLVSFLDTLASGAEAWTTTIQQVKDLTASMDDLRLGFNFNLESFALMAKGLAELNPFVMLKNGVLGFYNALKEGKGIFESWRHGVEEMVAGLGDLIAGALGNVTNAAEAISTPAPESTPAPASTPASHSVPLGPVPSNTSHGPPRRFQHGGAFTVGGFGGPDSQLVQFLATPGERVSVAPQGQGGGITINVNGPGGRELAAIMQRKAEEAVEEYHNTVVIPWSNGN